MALERINLRVDAVVLARVKAAAAAEGLTVTAMLLGPWLDEKEVVREPRAASSPKVAGLDAKRPVPPSKVHSEGTFTGVPFGPVPRAPGSMLIDKGKGKR